MNDEKDQETDQEDIEETPDRSTEKREAYPPWSSETESPKIF